jgi:hypothetical protein
MNEENNNDNDIQEDSFYGRVLAAADANQRRCIEVMERVNKAYVVTPRDKMVTDMVETVVRNAVTCNGEGWMHVVLGEPRVGKSASLRKAFSDRPELARDGIYLPFVAFKAPSPCGHKQLGRAILRALGYDVQEDIAEHLTWEKVRRMLKKRHVRILWIDEMHHALRGMDIQKLRDTIKITVDELDWPLQIVLSGIPLLVEFVDGDRDKQIFGRSNKINLGTLDMPKHSWVVRNMVKELVVKHAGMTMSPDIEAEAFINRLGHAASHRFGLVAVLTRAAIEKALYDPKAGGAVGLGHYAAAFQGLAGCETVQNVFLIDKWNEVCPEKTLVERYFKEDHIAPPKPTTKPRKRKGDR